MAILLILIAAAANGARAEEPRFRLDLNGSLLAEIYLNCRVILENGKELEVERRAHLPKSYTFDGRAISCTANMLDSRASLHATLYQDGQVLVGDGISAVLPYVRVRSAGPWGEARAVAGGR